MVVDGCRSFLVLVTTVCWDVVIEDLASRIPLKKLNQSRKLRVFGPVRTTRSFIWFAKKSVNAKPFLVRTISCTHQNFCKRNLTSKIPSISFGGCKNFVRREDTLFLDIHPSLRHQISQHMDYEANVTVRLLINQFYSRLSVESVHLMHQNYHLWLLYLRKKYQLNYSESYSGNLHNSDSVIEGYQYSMLGYWITLVTYFPKVTIYSTPIKTGSAFWNVGQNNIRSLRCLISPCFFSFVCQKLIAEQILYQDSAELLFSYV